MNQTERLQKESQHSALWVLLNEDSIKNHFGPGQSPSHTATSLWWECWRKRDAASEERWSNFVSSGRSAAAHSSAPSSPLPKEKQSQLSIDFHQLSAHFLLLYFFHCIFILSAIPPKFITTYCLLMSRTKITTFYNNVPNQSLQKVAIHWLFTNFALTRNFHQWSQPFCKSDQSPCFLYFLHCKTLSRIYIHYT